MQDIGKLLKITMKEKQCSATCAFLCLAHDNTTDSDVREAQKSLDSDEKK